MSIYKYKLKKEQNFDFVKMLIIIGYLRASSNLAVVLAHK